MKFIDLKLNKDILKALKDLSFEIATPIQEQVIPYLLESDNDLIALAQTGTGKTAAFGTPILHKINVKKDTPQTIILCPTRELCLQITKDIMSYSKYIKQIKITAVYGGANIQSQIKSIKSGSHIIVGTPGRVIDLIKRKCLKLSQINSVVLDEADEMLNMGFKDDLDIILAETPEQKQTLLFSATMPKEVMKISKNYMYKPKNIEVAKRNQGAENIDHYYYLVNARDKYKALRRICDINPEIYGIIFCRTRRDTKDVADKLMQDGYNADAIHGDLSQSQRDHVMGKFRKRNLELLVATDVAARGIDINELTHVINYNLPDDNEVYVHRSGRTGRAGNKGVSIIIAHSRDGRKLKAIEKMIKRNLIAKKIPSGEEICQNQLMKLIDKVVSTNINTKINDYLPAIEEKLAHLEKDKLIKHFVSSEFNRFLAFYENAPDLNITKESIKKDRKSKKAISERTGHAEKGYTRFFINIGKSKNLKTHNLIGLINEYTKKRNIPIGKIDLMRNFSFFEAPSEFEADILKGFKKSSWNNINLKVEVSQDPNNKKKKRVTSKTLLKTNKRNYTKANEDKQSKKGRERRKKRTKKSNSFKDRFKNN